MTAESAITSAEVVAARLPQRRLGSRYHVDDVDVFLDRCSATLQAWEHGHTEAATVRSDDVILRQFKPAGAFTPGYDADAVDDLLDRIATRLRDAEA